MRNKLLFFSISIAFGFWACSNPNKDAENKHPQKVAETSTKSNKYAKLLTKKWQLDNVSAYSIKTVGSVEEPISKIMNNKDSIVSDFVIDSAKRKYLGKKSKYWKLDNR